APTLRRYSGVKLILFSVPGARLCGRGGVSAVPLIPKGGGYSRTRHQRRRLDSCKEVTLKLLRGRRGGGLGAFLGYVLLALGFSAAYGASASRTPASVRSIGITAFSSATYSSPIAMSADNSRIWVVNPDDDSVSVIDPATDSVVNKFNVGDEPQSVALDA